MTEKEYQVLIAFMRDGWSHRKIQDEILGIPAPERGGGFEAMKILHKYHIHGDQKNSLKGKRLSREVLDSVIAQEATHPSPNTNNATSIHRSALVTTPEIAPTQDQHHPQVESGISLEIFRKNTANGNRGNVEQIAKALQKTMSQRIFRE